MIVSGYNQRVNDAMAALQNLVAARLDRNLRQIQNLQALSGKSETAVNHMLREVQRDKQRYDASVNAYKAARAEFKAQGQILMAALNLTTLDDVIEEAFLEGVSNVTALSLGAGVPTEASFPHLVLDAFKDLLAISLETEYTFEEFNGAQLKEDIKSGKAAAAAPAAGAAAAAPAAAAAAAPAEESEEEDDFGMGGLF